jgi:hypothetical protein
MTGFKFNMTSNNVALGGGGTVTCKTIEVRT